jgi:hypothetical protein
MKLIPEYLRDRAHNKIDRGWRLMDEPPKRGGEFDTWGLFQF